ncbi:MAG: UDP-N-acetylglucosamine 2-epimerase (non-hydrolyzing) [Gammaproteobacteria bacterium]|nr:UDP-N-acetylglucosamine 2-epimerase (non-hydrolyzing) [Gammaproteobacteria bacterium]
MKCKILSVFGTRPEAIKMAPLIKAMAASPKISSYTCVTGQHREMLDQVLNLFEIVPDFDLSIMKSGQDLAHITSAVLQKLTPVLQQIEPDRILVHGDTTTTMAATMACFYQHLPVGHVEAGLRTGNIKSPWPEEMNRKLVSMLADMHFAPTPLASDHLIAEGVHPESIIVTGNTVVDATLMISDVLRSNQEMQKKYEDHFSFLESSKRVILVTAHRRENFGAGIEGICEALKQLASREDTFIVYPVHPNPMIKEPVTRMLGKVKNVRLISPLEYLPFTYLMNRADIILTDSGGIQEEAPSLGKPVLVMRDTTERPEAVEAGTVKLVGTDSAAIVDATAMLLQSEVEYKRMAYAHNPYGDGKASGKIVDFLVRSHLN